MNTTLGQRISHLRKQKSLTQDSLADALGVSAQAVSKWENDISCPDIMLLPKLAKLLNVTVDELLTGNTAPETRLAPPEEKKAPEQQILRLVVSSADGDKVRVNLPLQFIASAIDMGASLDFLAGGDKETLSKIDFVRLLAMANMGLVGKLIELEAADGDKIEVWVE